MSILFKPLAGALVRGKGKLKSTDPWIWLIAVQVDASNAFRLALYTSDVVIYENTTGSSPYTAVTYEAFPIAQTTLEKSQRGDLGDVTLTVSNISQEVAAYVNAANLSGNDVRLMMVNSSSLGSTFVATSFAIDERFQIESISSNDEVVEFHLGHFNLFRKGVPSRSFQRGKCPFIFRGLECGYTVPTGTANPGTISNGFNLASVSQTTCDLTLNGANGCRAHGEMEKAVGVPKIHPRLFGGFPGIVKGKGL